MPKLKNTLKITAGKEREGRMILSFMEGGHPC
jgi:hypothetical protein